MSKPKTPSARKEWPDSVRKLWRHVHEHYVLDRHHVAILTEACEMLSRAAQCRTAIETSGVTVIDRYGNPQPNKMLGEERSCANAGRLLLRELSLDSVDGAAPGLPEERARAPRTPDYE